jgi:hypothetical protein
MFGDRILGIEVSNTARHASCGSAILREAIAQLVAIMEAGIALRMHLCPDVTATLCYSY